MDIEKLADRLAYYNEWRRGLDGMQPHPVELGADIDKAVSALREIARLRAEVEALKAKLAEAKKDSERLDFLENSHGDGHFQLTQREGIPEFDVEAWYDGEWLVGEGTDLRSAIDAARLGEGGGQ